MPVSYIMSRMGSASTPIPMPAGREIINVTRKTDSTETFKTFLSLTAHAAESAGIALTPSVMVIEGIRFLKSSDMV